MGILSSLFGCQPAQSCARCEAEVENDYKITVSHHFGLDVYQVFTKPGCFGSAMLLGSLHSLRDAEDFIERHREVQSRNKRGYR